MALCWRSLLLLPLLGMANRFNAEIRAASLPSSCTPTPLLSVGGLCVYGYQCQSKFCCPRMKLCLAGGGVSSNDINVEDDMKSEVFSMVFRDGGTCKNPWTNRKQCLQMSGGKPLSTWDQSACECKEAYMDRYNAGTWVTLNKGIKCGTYVPAPPPPPPPPLPSSCTPTPLLPKGGLCVYGYQCQSKFCCPRMKLCLADGGVSSNDINVEDDMRSEVFSMVFHDGGTCKNPWTNRKQCLQMRGGKPLSTWDQSACECKKAYMDRYNAGTWVTLNKGIECATDEPSPTTTTTTAAAATTTTAATATATAPAPPSSSLNNAEIQAVLDKHNVYRCMHEVPLLEWDSDIAANAQKWADEAVWQHSSRQSRSVNGVQCGENLAWGSPSQKGAQATINWYSEIKFTDPYGTADNSSDTTTPGEAIGHYTAVVWKATTKVGCGKGRLTMDGYEGDYWVCQYGPAGNWLGRYKENVLAPTKSVTSCGGDATDVP